MVNSKWNNALKGHNNSAWGNALRNKINRKSKI
jgi:hypothetical protein